METLLRISERNKINNKLTICQFHEIDKYLSQLFDGALSKKEANRFLYSLAASEGFYKRVLQKILESDLNRSDSIIMYPEMRSDDEIIEKIKENSILGMKKYCYITLDSISKHLHRINIFKSTIKLKYRIATYVTISIIVITCGVWRFGRYKEETKLSEFDVFQQTVPFIYNESGLRDIDGIAIEPKEIAFYQQFKMSMTDYVNGKYDKAVVLFRKGLPDAINMVQNPLMIKVVRNYFFYWGISRLAGIHQKAQISLKDQQSLFEVVRLINTALSIAKQNKLEKIDREEFYLGLTLGLAGKKDKACECLRKISEKSMFHSDARILIGLWK